MKWRVRAVRRVFGTVPNGLPAVSYGPWSPVYTASNPAIDDGQPQGHARRLRSRSATGSKQSAHELMPGPRLQRRPGAERVPMTSCSAPTPRPIVDCVNIVYKGSIVGSPAYAPRTSGPLRFEDDLWAHSRRLSASRTQFRTAHRRQGSGRTTGARSSPTRSPLRPRAAPRTTARPASDDESATAWSAARVDLPDIDFPTTRYYWTVVPVDLGGQRLGPDRSRRLVGHRDAAGCLRRRPRRELRQGERAGRDGRLRQAVRLRPDARTAGCSPRPARSPKVFSTPLVAWQPATGATAYRCSGHGRGTRGAPRARR